MGKALMHHVDAEVRLLETGIDCDGQPVEAFAYLEDALDTQLAINVTEGEPEFCGVELCVAWGGPGIWVDTQCHTVTGYWGGDKYERTFRDFIGLSQAAESKWGGTWRKR